MRFFEIRRKAPAWPVPARAVVIGLLLFQGIAVFAAADEARLGPTVQEVVEFTRIVHPPAGDVDQLRAQVSPDGRHVFIVTRRSDVATDRNLFDILLLDLDRRRLAAGRQGAPQRLLRVASRNDPSQVMPSIREIRWVGNRTLVFLGSLRDSPFQVYRLDVPTRRLRQLTFARHPIVSFDISLDLRHIAYTAQVANPPMGPGARHVVVGNQSFWSVKFGQQDLRQQMRLHRYFFAAAGSRQPDRPLGPAFQSNAYAPRPSISPDGRWVLAPRYDAARHPIWVRHYPIVAQATARFARSLAVDPLGYFSRPLSYVPRRLVAYRVADGHEQDVLDAPDDAMTNASQWRSDRLWQGRGESVVLAGVHLPSGSVPGAGNASHLVEYWPDSRRWEVIAPLAAPLVAAYPIAGPKGAFVAIEGERRRHFERRDEGGWAERPSPVTEPLAMGGAPVAMGPWRLRIEEDMNRPGDVIATDADGQTVALTRLNPRFSTSSWGEMRPYAWTDGNGRIWEGGLMIPSGPARSRPRALVIQTYHFTRDRFYLDGPDAGFSSGFAGRAFLREDMLVLAMPWGPASGGPTDERSGIQAFLGGVQGAIAALSRDGLVDPDRVGILGWSATGERVLNLVTFSPVPIRAATLLDGDANTLFSYTVTYGAGDAMSTRRERVNDALPFGESFARWARHDPSMHTDCVTAALRIETYGPAVLNNWDIYALLRRQYKAVEMIVIPEGSHSLSRPSERMVSLQGNVDWFRFWLNGEERDVPVVPGETARTLAAQYVRWREMAELKRADDARPRCARREGGR